MNGKVLNSKGQALLETVITLPIILFILFAMISISIYIYDMSVFVFATNKAMDKVVGVLTSEGLSEEDKDKVIEIAQNCTNTRILASEPKVEILEDTDDSIVNKITIRITSKFQCLLPFIDDLMKDVETLKFESTYVYKKE